MLGAGYDSRAFRFADELRGVNVFEVDHPGTQARKTTHAASSSTALPGNVTLIGIDFTAIARASAAAARLRAATRKTLFLWEGVSYYLPRAGGG